MPPRPWPCSFSAPGATSSHELRTPLNAVYGWTRLLGSGDLDAAASDRALETIERNAHAQVRLIDDLLDVSRIITGKMRLDVGPMALREVTRAAVDSLRPAAEAKEITIEERLDPAADRIAGDPDRLQQAICSARSRRADGDDGGRRRGRRREMVPRGDALRRRDAG